ncbi:MAG: hypothetical protein FWD33_01855 [Alphaproteobacteria bacterium]|nr:hypothetical protein [Alphaproteobacteria bacterium]
MENALGILNDLIANKIKPENTKIEKHVIGVPYVLSFEDIGKESDYFRIHIENEYEEAIKNVEKRLTAAGIEFVRSPKFIRVKKSEMNRFLLEEDEQKDFKAAASRVEDMTVNTENVLDPSSESICGSDDTTSAELIKSDDIKFGIHGTHGGFCQWAGDTEPYAYDTRGASENKNLTIAKWKAISYSYSKTSVYERHGDDEAHPLLDSGGDLRDGNMTFALSFGNRILTDNKILTDYLDKLFKQIYNDGVIVKNWRIEFKHPYTSGNLAEADEYLNKKIEMAKKELPGVIGDKFIDIPENMKNFSNLQDCAYLSPLAKHDDILDALKDGNRVFLHKKYAGNMRYAPKPKVEVQEAVTAPVDKVDKTVMQKIFNFFGRGNSN